MLTTALAALVFSAKAAECPLDTPEDCIGNTSTISVSPGANLQDIVESLDDTAGECPKLYLSAGQYTVNLSVTSVVASNPVHIQGETDSEGKSLVMLLPDDDTKPVIAVSETASLSMEDVHILFDSEVLDSTDAAVTVAGDGSTFRFEGGLLDANLAVRALLVEDCATAYVDDTHVKNGSVGNGESGGLVRVHDNAAMSAGFSDFERGQADEGGLFSVGSGSQVFLQHSTLSGGTAMRGGGAHVENGGEFVTTSTDSSENLATVSGGLLYVDSNGQATVSGGEHSARGAPEASLMFIAGESNDRQIGRVDIGEFATFTLVDLEDDNRFFDLAHLLWGVFLGDVHVVQW
jgi:hypothetical protein